MTAKSADRKNETLHTVTKAKKRFNLLNFISNVHALYVIHNNLVQMPMHYI